MPRKEYTIHYIYKITCTINGKYYIGMHSTFNLEDGYMGSGKRIKRSIEKHGLENHVKEILEFLPNKSSLKEREKEIVNGELIKDSLCMNLQLGGGGGFINKEHMMRCSLAGAKTPGRTDKSKATLRKKLKYPLYLENYRNKIKEGLSKISKDVFATYSMLGKKHSSKSKLKMSKSHSGSNNSQFGKFWITNGKENKKVSTENEIPKGWNKGRKIKTHL